MSTYASVSCTLISSLPRYCKSAAFRHYGKRLLELRLCLLLIYLIITAMCTVDWYHGILFKTIGIVYLYRGNALENLFQKGTLEP